MWPFLLSILLRYVNFGLPTPPPASVDSASAAPTQPHYFLPHFAERAVVILPRLFGLGVSSSVQGIGSSAEAADPALQALMRPLPPTPVAVRALMLDSVLVSLRALFACPVMPRASLLAVHSVGALAQVLAAALPALNEMGCAEAAAHRLWQTLADLCHQLLRPSTAAAAAVAADETLDGGPNVKDGESFARLVCLST
jgi:hypothetical protein